MDSATLRPLVWPFSRPAPRTTPPTPIERIVEGRLAQPSVFRHRARGTVQIEAGAAGAFTIHLSPDRPRIERGRVRSPTATVEADPDTMVGVLEGSFPGLDAFFAGKLAVRGNVGLALKLDLFYPPPRLSAHAPRPGIRTIDGIETFYLDAGPRDAPVVVFLHGLGATNVSMLPTFAALCRDHRVLAPDLPGFGESGKPLRARYDFSFFCRWLIGFLDALLVPKASLVGNSMGGRISLEVGLRHPERIDKLVLLAPSMAWRSYRQLAPLARLLRPEMGLVPIPLLRAQVLLTLRSLFVNAVPAAWIDAAVDEFLHVFASPRGRIAFFAAARQIYLEDPHGEQGFWDRLRKLEAPSLFVWGERDWLVPKGFARHTADAVPHATSVVLDACGHVPQYDAADRVDALVRAFL